MDCLVRSFAEVSGVPADRIIECIGHDGRQILWSELPAPLCFAGFHIEELLYTMDELGFTCSIFIPEITYSPQQLMKYEEAGKHFNVLYLNFNEKFSKIAKTSSGVMLGRWPERELHHAIPCFYGYYKENGKEIMEYTDYQNPFICECFVRINKNK